MSRLTSFPLKSLLLLMVCASSCGSNRHLQSVSISPATADAKDYPNGLVPFVATGMFSSPPSPAALTSQEVTWCYGGMTNVANPVAGVCAGNIAQFATVDQNGVAQCAPTFTGTVYILAGTPSSPVMPDMGAPLKIFGSAQLTCP